MAILDPSIACYIMALITYIKYEILVQTVPPLISTRCPTNLELICMILSTIHTIPS